MYIYILYNIIYLILVNFGKFKLNTHSKYDLEYGMLYCLIKRKRNEQFTIMQFCDILVI